MSFVTRYYSGADQNTVGIYWFYIKLQNLIDNKQNSIHSGAYNWCKRGAYNTMYRQIGL